MEICLSGTEVFGQWAAGYIIIQTQTQMSDLLLSAVACSVKNIFIVAFQYDGQLPKLIVFPVRFEDDIIFINV